MNKSVNKEKKGLTKSKQSSPRQKEDVETNDKALKT